MFKGFLRTCLLCCLCTSSNVWAQSRKISGKVLDKGTSEPLPGVSISVKGTTTGTITDAKGTFKLQVLDKPGSVLVVKSIGFIDQQQVMSGQSDYTISMEPFSKQLNEVMVSIGYANVKRSELPGAVVSLSEKDLKDAPGNSLAEVLAGRLAGVQVTVSEGSPGASAEINIRGRNSITQNSTPLYIVDGVQVDNALNAISPQNVATIDVLKDAASTAIYGARGSNGVIIITTKGGKNTNGKIKTSYEGFIGIQNLSKKLAVMNTADFLQYQYERFRLTNDSSFIDRYTRVGRNYDTLKRYRDAPTTDWQQRLFGRNAVIQTHIVTITGGTPTTQFNFSVTNNSQQGILLGSDYNRNLVNFRFNQKVSEAVQAAFNVRYNRQVVNGAGTSDVGGAGSNNLRQIVRYPPFIAGRDDQSAYDPALDAATNGNGLRLVNPLEILPATYRKSSTNVLNFNTNLSYRFKKNLTLRSTLGYDVNSTERREYNDTLNRDAQDNLKLPTAVLTTGQVITLNNSNVIDYTNSAFLKNSKNSISFLLGQEFYLTHSRGATQSIRYFPVGLSPDQAFANLSLAQAPAGYIQPTPTSSEVPVRTFSFFSRINYTYASRYILSLSVRADGSSIFASGKQWGYFPAASAAWRIDQEKFMRGFKVLSDLKLRLTYGTSGNNRITPFSFDPAYSTGKSYYLNGVPVLGLAPGTVLNNPEVHWEVLNSKNLGLDVGLLQGRIQLSADAYQNITSKLLINNAIPTNSGYLTQFQNVGSTGNRGLEFVLNAVIKQSKRFYWKASINAAFNKNTIRSLGTQQSFTANSGWFSASNAPADFIVKVGEEIGTMYGLKNDGYYKLSDFDTAPYNNPSYPWATTQYTLKQGVPTSSILGTVMPGSVKFVDVNGDGKVDGNDYTVIGHALPKGTGGITQQFRLGRFDASLFFNFSYGNQVYNYNKLEFTNGYTVGANLLSIFNDRWHVIDPKTGTSTQRIIGATVIGASPEIIGSLNNSPTYWLPGTGVEYSNPQSFAVESGSYVRLNNITLGYSFPPGFLARAKASTFRVYVTGNNLTTITGYSGYSPSVSTRRNTTLTPGVDYAAYPPSRTYLMGVNLSF